MNDGTEKVIGLYEYIKALSSMDEETVLNINDEANVFFIQSDLSFDSDNIKCYHRDRVSDDTCDSDVSTSLLVIKRPDFEACPKPPDSLDGWLLPGWDSYLKHETEDKRLNLAYYANESFSDSEKRVDAFNKWNNDREEWITTQKKIAKTRELFSKFFSIYRELERDSETKEFMIGEGILQTAENKNIYYPVLLKRVCLNFDAKINEITVTDTDVEPEINTRLMEKLKDIDVASLSELKEILLNNALHPLDSNDTPVFLKQLVHSLDSNGVFVKNAAELYSKRATFSIHLDPVYFMRKKSTGIAGAVDKIIKDITAKEQIGILSIPPYLLNIVGEGSISNLPVNYDDIDEFAAVNGESSDVLFAGKANREQLEIAKKIELNNAVVVQGPPGTGKTHTIANLLGHFLAQGKTVLVTSHRKKALSVLKNKIHKKIQDLCVSILDDNNRDMMSSVSGILENIASESLETLAKKINEIEGRRKNTIEKLADVRKAIFSQRNLEIKSVVYDGIGYSPTEMAKFVRENKEELESLITGDLYGESLPLSREELASLYSTNTQISQEDEFELSCYLPEPSKFINSDDFCYKSKLASEQRNGLNSFCAKLDIPSKSVTIEDRKLGRTVKVHLCSEDACDSLLEYIKKNNFNISEGWEFAAAAAGVTGDAGQLMWREMISVIDDTCKFSASFETKRVGRSIYIGRDDVDNAYLSYLRQELPKLRNINSGGFLSRLTDFLRKDTADLHSIIRIDGSPISNDSDMDTVFAYISLLEKQIKLERYWDCLMFSKGAPKFEALGLNPEQKCKSTLPNIERCLDWYTKEYGNIFYELKQIGFNPEELFRPEAFYSNEDNIRKIIEICVHSIPNYLEIVKKAFSLIEFDACKNKLIYELSMGDRKYSNLCKDFAKAIREEDAEQYAKMKGLLTVAYAKGETAEKRDFLLRKLEGFAPAWAQAIRKREEIHGETHCPTRILDAVKWRFFVSRLDLMLSESNDDLQKKSEKLSSSLREDTAELASLKAWYELRRRVDSNLEMKHALGGWALAVKKIGKGTGKNAPMLKKEAREHMRICQKAVPAWIMTVDKALEGIDPSANKFDIIIIDEASQSDISAIAVLYMTEKVIVVGDDKQVSPDAVGVDMTRVQNLKSAYLKNNNALTHLFDPKTSIYDVAKTTFTPSMLKEHFRCVPDIIGYSNKLCYDGKIKPLRDDSSCALKPSIVSYRVDGKRASGSKKINEEEALVIVSLIMACIEQDEYQDSTFGVISLLGEEQSSRIDGMLSEKLEPAVIDKHRILCGNPPHFQGDERSVVFLSMVDSNEGEGPLRMKADGPGQSNQQRYNVAVSRAKDQLWIVHSLDYASDLKNDDLRRDLLEYAQNPKSFIDALSQIQINSESEFEKEVAKSLLSSGYNIVQQWEAGAFRIDIVVLCGEKRIAIECDGERYHSTPEKIKEDMSRQMILERFGWRFIRIRGSEYYRNPEETMERVRKELTELGIFKEDILQNNTEAAVTSELFERVKARAAAIRRDWDIENTFTGEVSNSKKEDALSDIKDVCRDNTATTHTQSFLFQEENIDVPLTPDRQDEKEKDVNPERNNIGKKTTSTRKSISAEYSPKAAIEQVNSNNLSGEKIDKHPLMELLDMYAIPYVRSSENSNILWVIFSEDTCAAVEAIFTKQGLKYFLEKRGAIATSGYPAWRVNLP